MQYHLASILSPIYHRLEIDTFSYNINSLQYHFNTFIDTSGTGTYTKILLKLNVKKKKEFDYTRYFFFRLTPAYGLIMLLLSTILLHMGSGPLWAFMDREAEKCEAYWWTNLLYINNFIHADE